MKRKKEKYVFEGSYIDTLFIRGEIDLDMYLDYLKEFAKQKQKKGVAHRAIVVTENGKQRYKWIKKKEHMGYQIGEVPCYLTHNYIEDFLPRVGKVKWWTDIPWYQGRELPNYQNKPIEDIIAENVREEKKVKETEGWENIVDDILRAVEE